MTRWMIWGSVLVLATAPASTFAEPPDVLPATVAEAVNDLLGKLPAKDQDALRAMHREDLIQLHRGLGMSLRNQYDLWGSNQALLESACGPSCDPEEASMAIIDATWVALQPKGAAMPPRPAPVPRPQPPVSPAPLAPVACRPDDSADDIRKAEAALARAQAARDADPSEDNEVEVVFAQADLAAAVTDAEVLASDCR